MKAYYIPGAVWESPLLLLFWKSLWVSDAFCEAIAKCQHFCVAHVVQLLSRVWFFATPWTAACQASLSFTISWSLLKLLSIESVMPFNHLFLCHPVLLPSLFPSFRVFSNELALRIRWQSIWSFGFQWIFRTHFLFRLSCGDLSPRYCLSYRKPSLDDL